MQDTERVYRIIEELSALDDIKAEQNLQTDLLFDSLLMVTLLIQIEEEFGIELNESDMNPFDLITVQDVVELVEKYWENGDE